jgi:hypothetical protein
MTMNSKSPWTVDYSGPARLAVNDKDGRSIFLGNLQNEDGDEDEANAILIAAAPELLEALQGLLKNAPPPKGIRKDFAYILYLEAAKKAIAKATGQS